MRKIVLFCYLQCFVLCNVFAQNVFKGRVVDENNRPVKEAIVFQLGEDASIRNTVLVDSSGNFSIDKVDFSKEILRVTAFGFENKDITKSTVEPIVLKVLSVALGEVVVQGEAKVEQKSDRLVFTVANTNLVKASNSSFDLVKMTPMVENRNERLSILGKESVELYINGRKSNLTQDAMRSYLLSLPADRIANIEVITNPGVTNSVSANTGIINLVLKKNEADGVKGSVSFEDSQKRLNSQNGSLYLEVQSGKLNLSGNFYGNNGRAKTDSETDYYYATQKWDHGENEIENHTISGGGNLRMDYNLSKEHIIGALIDYYHNENTDETDNITTYFSDYVGSVSDSIYNAWNQDKELTNRISANVNYRGKLSDKDNLTIDFDYFWNKKEHTTHNDFVRQAIGLLPEREERFNERSEETFNNYSGKAEYKHTFNPAHSLTAGAEFSRTSQDADFSHTDIMNDIETPDLSKNNYFEYDETLLKAYLSWNWRFGNKWMGNAGVRLENADIKGIQRVTGETVKRSDLDFVPNLSVMFILNPKNQFGYNFMSMVGRPGFYSLNPFQFYITPNTYKAYNSSLKTSRSYMQSLMYSFNNHYMFGVDYMYGTDVTNNFYIPVNDQYTKLINANYGDLHLVMVKFAWNQAFLQNRLFVNLAAIGGYQRAKGAVESIIIDTEGFIGNINLNANAILSPQHQWSLSFSGNYSPPMKGGAHEDLNSRFRGNVGIQKVFKKGITLNFGGYFAAHNDIREKSYSNYAYYAKTNWDVYGGFVKLTVPFGNTKTKGAQNRGTSSSSSRLKE